jgi:hypothetical protein
MNRWRAEYDDGISVPYEALKKLVKRVRKERER